MAKSTPALSKPRDPRAAAGVAGIGSGTGLLALAHSLPDDAALKPWLVFAAPAVSIIASALWIQAQIEFATLTQEIKFNWLVSRARTRLKNAINDPLTDPKAKEELRTKLQYLESVIVERDLLRLRSMT
jgi:hypothetical protein